MARSLDALKNARHDFLHRGGFAKSTLVKQLHDDESITITAATRLRKAAIFYELLSSMAAPSSLSPELAANARVRGWGSGRGLISVAPDFDAPLPPDMQEAFEA